jgi:phosphoribosyl-ATP pyrophosphohydrolase
MSDFTLEDLAGIIAARAKSGDRESYTARLLGKGPAECAKKLGEEAVEAAIAAVAGDREALRAEAADVLYHLLVLLQVSDVSFAEVKAELAGRTGRSGLEEKAARSAGR